MAAIHDLHVETCNFLHKKGIGQATTFQDDLEHVSSNSKVVQRNLSVRYPNSWCYYRKRYAVARNVSSLFLKLSYSETNLNR